MTTLLFSLALIVLTVALIAMLMPVKHLTKVIDEIKEKLEDRNKVEKYYLDFLLSEHEKRLGQLEDAELIKNSSELYQAFQKRLKH